MKMLHDQQLLKKKIKMISMDILVISAMCICNIQLHIVTVLCSQYLGVKEKLSAKTTFDI